MNCNNYIDIFINELDCNYFSLCVLIQMFSIVCIMNIVPRNIKVLQYLHLHNRVTLRSLEWNDLSSVVSLKSHSQGIVYASKSHLTSLLPKDTF